MNEMRKLMEAVDGPVNEAEQLNEWASRKQFETLEDAIKYISGFKNPGNFTEFTLEKTRNVWEFFFTYENWD